MKRSSVVFFLIPALMFIALSCEKKPGIKTNDLDLSKYVTVQAYCGDQVTSKLFAAKKMEVGTVTVSKNPDGTLKVVYQLIPGYYMNESHLSVTNSLDAVARTQQLNPQVGLFKYSAKHEPPVNMYIYDNLEAGSIIMAHVVAGPAEDYEANIPALDIVLPSTASIRVSSPVAGGESYFRTTVTDGGILNGTYDGWCVDVDHVIYSGTPYTVRVISSYNPVVNSSGMVEFPENLDKVNWVINQDFVGKASQGGYGAYTYGDVQRAIWELIDDTPSSSGLGLWSPSRVSEILASAANPGEGDGFVPDCGQKVAILLWPNEMNGMGVQITVAQVTIINYNQVCIPVLGDAESAWAAGKDFGGSNWAKYFYFCY